MTTIGVFEAKTHLSALIERVRRGEEIVIAKHGHPLARLVPVDERTPEEQRRILDTIERLHAFRKRQTLGRLTVRELRDTGRRG